MFLTRRFLWSIRQNPWIILSSWKLGKASPILNLSSKKLSNCKLSRGESQKFEIPERWIRLGFKRQKPNDFIITHPLIPYVLS